MKDKMLLDKLAAEAKLGRISRRDFMHYSIAAGVTASAATGLWTTAANAAGHSPKQEAHLDWEHTMETHLIASTQVHI